MKHLSTNQIQAHALSRAGKNLTYITGPSGGLSYHWTALRYRKTLWRGFISTLGQWLNENWHPIEKQILIFGSSAGWTLDEKFINRFDKVTCIEPDPIARLLFRRRFPQTKNLSFVADAQILPWFNSDASGDQFSRFLELHPEATILFSNLLGQIPLLTREKDSAFMSQARTSFMRSLKNRSWASYHDLFSVYGNEIKPSAPRVFNAKSELTQSEFNSEKIAALFFKENSQITDHETGWLSIGRQTDFAIWNIRPKTYHVISMVKSAEPSPEKSSK